MRWTTRIKRWLDNQTLADILLWALAGVLIGVWLDVLIWGRD